MFVPSCAFARLVPFLGALALSGAPVGAQEILHTFVGSTADSYGQVCDLIGDTDGDGAAEALVGAWRDDAPGSLTDAGSLFVYDGATGSLVRNVFGTGAGDHMGYGSSSAGDANGDGIFDILAAADEDDTAAGTNAGSALVVDGATGLVLWQVEGDDASDLFGWSTAAAGDIDNDGFDDVVIGALLDDGAPGGSSAGSLTAFSGIDGTVIHKIYGPIAGGNLGSNVGRAGDVNGDGHADIMGARGPRVLVYSGADGTLLHDLANGGLSAEGRCSGGIDVNLDGFDDLVIGNPTSQSLGRVRVVSGVDGTILYEIFGDVVGDRLGSAVFGLGDVNGDGYPDFCAGSDGDDAGGSNAGSLRAFSGKDGSEIMTVPGDAANRRMGTAMGGGHDVNGDGVKDAIASSNQSARAWVVSFVPTGVEPFGTGTPGCAGMQPIGTNGPATVGDAGFTVYSGNSTPGAGAILAISANDDPLGTLFLGALLHVAGGGFFQLVAAPPADAKGSLAIPVPVPNDSAQIGMTYTFQVGSLWPSASCGESVSTSRGLRVTIQP
ncbi:MAG: integrin alpha [Planctomycetota bacterium]